MKNKYSLVALMGKSASGKDTLLNKLCKKFPSLNKKISTTTRPIRDYEKEGIDYYFVSVEEFTEKILNFEMIEATDFREWFYGTELKTLREDCLNIGVFNPDGIRALKENSQIELHVIYVVAEDSTRLIRSLSREANPDIEEIFRRYRKDQEDFSDLDFDFDTVVNTNGTDIDDLVKQVETLIVKTLGKRNKVIFN